VKWKDVEELPSKYPLRSVERALELDKRERQLLQVV
jgi:hypothetical protein